MASTTQFGLPLLAPSQAQKHVTMNEALAILDAVAQLRVLSSTVQIPPTDVDEGGAYLVPVGASGEWTGRSKRVAVWSNGGWLYLTPKAGWCAWDEETNGRRVFDGTDWVADALVISPKGASASWRLIEFDHLVTAGTNNTTSFTIPGNSQVHAVTGRVVEALSGTALTGWRIGVAGADNRYGSGIGTARNASFIGVSGTPVTYYENTPIQLRADAGSFLGGRIRIAVTLTEFRAPRAD